MPRKRGREIGRKSKRSHRKASTTIEPAGFEPAGSDAGDGDQTGSGFLGSDTDVHDTTACTPDWSLQWLRPPIKTYRARYMNELSKRGNCRGALENDSGDGWPVVKISGLSAHDSVCLDICAATSDGQQHPFFFCRTAGRDAPTSCHGVQLKNGCQALRFTARRENDYTCELKHVGVVRLRKESVSNRGGSGLASNQTNYFHIKVIARLAKSSTSTSSTVTLLSEAIKCISSTQALSNPIVTQVLQLQGKPSSTEGVDVIAIGKDFLPSTHFRVFQLCTDKNMWRVTIPPLDCTVHCSHNCCVQFKLPPPPSNLVRSGSGKRDLQVYIDAASNTSRRSTAAVPLNKAKAFLFQYPAECEKDTTCSGAVRSSCSMTRPTTSVLPMPVTVTSSPASTNPRVAGNARRSSNTIQSFLRPPTSLQVPLSPFDLAVAQPHVPSGHMDLVTPFSPADYPRDIDISSSMAMNNLMCTFLNTVTTSVMSSPGHQLHQPSMATEYSSMEAALSMASSPLLGISGSQSTMAIPGLSLGEVSDSSQPDDGADTGEKILAALWSPVSAEAS